MLGETPIFWKSKCQASISQSNYESEYYALSKARKKRVWLWLLFLELGHISVAPIVIWADNQVSTFFNYNEYGLMIESCNREVGMTEKK